MVIFKICSRVTGSVKKLYLFNFSQTKNISGFPKFSLASLPICLIFQFATDTEFNSELCVT